MSFKIIDTSTVFSTAIQTNNTEDTKALIEGWIPLGTGGFLSRMVGNAESVSMPLRYHEVEYSYVGFL